MLSMTTQMHYAFPAGGANRRAAGRWSALMLCVTLAGLFGVLVAVLKSPAQAQDWQTGISPNTTTLVPRSDTPQPPPARRGSAIAMKLVAYLTVEGQRIDDGLIWRIYTLKKGQGAGTLKETSRKAQPTVYLKPGRYVVNVSFGRAHITRPITVTDNDTGAEKKFTLNAGGLRVKALIEAGSPEEATSVRYDIFSDRDQLDNRELVLANVKPNLVIRLNSGIYHIVSKYGDANATVASDITVEPGKLTEATVTHEAAKVRFKLVARPGGEALPDTQWQVKTTSGDVVKRSVGALPTHILATGNYRVVGTSDGQSFEQEFSVSAGRMIDVEVLKR